MRLRTRELALVAVILSACSGAAPTVRGPAVTGRRVDLAPRPTVGASYEILHRETREVVGEEARRVQTRTLLEVLSEGPDGSRRVRARLFRSIRDTGEDERLLDEVALFDLSPMGEIVGEPERECGAIDDLRIGRYLRHLFGARAFFARDVGESSVWRADYLSDATELPSPATFRIDELSEDEAVGRLSTQITMEQGDFGPLRMTGRGRVRGHFTVSLSDGFAGRTDLQGEFQGQVVGDGRSRTATLRTRSQVLVRRASVDDAAQVSCDRFDPSIVTRQIQARIAGIQRCYEAQLVRDPTLRGRLVISFTIGTDGRVSEVVVRENSVGSPAVAACVTDVISRFRFSPGPTGGSVTFAYPFVFAPQN